MFHAVLRVFALALVCGPALSFAGERSVFANASIHSRYSPFLLEKNAKADSLLPALDGDKSFNELIRMHPKLWSIERLDKLGEMVTRLNVEVVYIDGIREDQFCEIDKDAGRGSDEWSVHIGVDFVSGGSNTVPVHVQQCLEYVRNELGYKVKKGDRIVEIPAKKVLDEIQASAIPQVLDPDLQAKVLNAHREVNLSGTCPTDIEAYAILLDVWDQLKKLPMDIGSMNDHLNPENNGGRKVHSCAFSREWNAKYSEESALSCDVPSGFCKYVQSEDGTTRWNWDANADVFVFEPLKILFLSFGGKSIHEGGKMLDLRILPLSSSLWLEAYVNELGFPVTLGLITVPQ